MLLSTIASPTQPSAYLTWRISGKTGTKALLLSSRPASDPHRIHSGQNYPLFATFASFGILLSYRAKLVGISCCALGFYGYFSTLESRIIVHARNMYFEEISTMHGLIRDMHEPNFSTFQPFFGNFWYFLYNLTCIL